MCIRVAGFSVWKVYNILKIYLKWGSFTILERKFVLENCTFRLSLLIGTIPVCSTISRSLVMDVTPNDASMTCGRRLSHSEDQAAVKGSLQ